MSGMRWAARRALLIFASLAPKLRPFDPRLRVFPGKARWHSACTCVFMRRPFWAITAFAVALLRAQAALDVPSQIPFEFREGLLWVKAAFPQSSEPLNFL